MRIRTDKLELESTIDQIVASIDEVFDFLDCESYDQRANKYGFFYQKWEERLTPMSDRKNFNFIFDAFMRVVADAKDSVMVVDPKLLVRNAIIEKYNDRMSRPL